MRTTVKDLKKWLEKLDDEAVLGVSVYKNNREKAFLTARDWNESGKSEEKEFTIFVEGDELN